MITGLLYTKKGNVTLHVEKSIKDRLSKRDKDILQNAKEVMESVYIKYHNNVPADICHKCEEHRTDCLCNVF